MTGNFTNYTWIEPEGPFEYALAIGWICFVIVVVGFIGNIAIVIVTCSKPWRGTALSVILIALTMSDILVLLSTPLTLFVYHVYDIDADTHSEALCKLNTFLFYAAPLTSAWLLVCVVLERMLNVVVTKESITRWTPRPLVAVVVVIAIWVICYAINTHFLEYMGLTRGSDTKYCSSSAVSENYDEFIRKQFPWFKLFIAYLVPHSMAVFGSIVILVNKERLTQSHTNTEPTSTSESLPRTTFRVTLMVLSITSIVTIGPQTIYRVYLANKNHIPNEIFYTVFTFDVLIALEQTNAAVKFYLYAISDKEFRDSLLALFGRKRRASPYLHPRTVPGNHMNILDKETRT